MKEQKSSEVKGVRRLESRETVELQSSQLGQPLSHQSERHAVALGPSGRPRGWEAALESKV